MSCACENKRLSQEADRIYRLAKAWAKMENETAIVYKSADGSYNFAPISKREEIENDIVEFVTPY